MLVSTKPRVAVLGSGTARSELPPHFFERADAEPWAAPIRLSAFARSPYERLVVDVGYVDAGQNAASASDVIFINSFADYGIDAMRAVLDIPVVGAGEATLLAASQRFERFAIITVWPESMRFLYDERLRALDLANWCVSIQHISPETELTKLGRDDGVMERMRRQETVVLDQLRSACRSAVERDGAECIVLGCTCMAPIGPKLASLCSVPVLESSRVGFTASIAAANGPNRHPTPQTANTLLPSLVDAWTGARLAATTASEPDCPVCN
jgi:allantoin racemase